jgi:hypothetical protein
MDFERFTARLNILREPFSCHQTDNERMWQGRRSPFAFPRNAPESLIWTAQQIACDFDNFIGVFFGSEHVWSSFFSLDGNVARAFWFNVVAAMGPIFKRSDRPDILPTTSRLPCAVEHQPRQAVEYNRQCLFGWDSVLLHDDTAEHVSLTMAANAVIPAHLSYLAIYNPALGPTDETVRDQIVFYYSHKLEAAHGSRAKAAASVRKVIGTPSAEQHDSVHASSEDVEAEENERLRQVGLAQGMVNFVK